MKPGALAAMLLLGACAHRSRVPDDTHWMVTDLSGQRHAIAIDGYTVRGRSWFRISMGWALRRWSGYTRAALSYRYEEIWVGDSCSVSELDFDRRIAIEFPRWKVPREYPDLLMVQWLEYTERLKTHELGHAAIALAGFARIEEGSRRAGCADLASVFRKRFSDLRKIQRAYDACTVHGQEQDRCALRPFIAAARYTGVVPR